jgi:hypothetical protein
VLLLLLLLLLVVVVFVLLLLLLVGCSTGCKAIQYINIISSRSQSDVKNLGNISGTMVSCCYHGKHFWCLEE